jgi:hypothetical protein
MPLIDKLREVMSTNTTNTKMKSSISQDVNKAITQDVFDESWFSRLANSFPSYSSESDRKQLCKKLLNLADKLSFLPSDSNNQRSVNELLLLATEQIDSGTLDPIMLLKPDQKSLALIKSFMEDLVREVSLQVLCKDGTFQTEFIDLLNMREAFSKFQGDYTKIRTAIILSIVNNLLIPEAFSEFRKLIDNLSASDNPADKKKAKELDVRYNLIYYYVNQMLLDRSFKNTINEITSSNIVIDYLFEVYLKNGHDALAINKILKGCYFGAEIEAIKPIKDHSGIRLYTDKGRAHREGDRILKFIGDHYPNLPYQLYNNIGSYLQTGEKQFVFAIKALVRMGKPELAHKVLYPSYRGELPEGELLLKTLKEDKIKTFYNNWSKTVNTTNSGFQFQAKKK